MPRKRDAAEFNETITLQVRADAARNDFAEEPPEGNWDTLGTRWAKVWLKSDQLTWLTGRDILEATHLIELWHDPVAAAMTALANRVLWNGRILRVITVEDFANQHLRLAIVCLERLGAVS